MMIEKEYNNKEEYVFDLFENDIWDSYIYSMNGLGYTYLKVLSKQERLIADMYVATQYHIDNQEWSNEYRDHYIASKLCFNVEQIRVRKSQIKKLLRAGYKERVDDQLRRYNFMKRIKNKLKSIFISVLVVCITVPCFGHEGYDPANHLQRFERERKIVEAEIQRRHELELVEKEAEVLGRLERLGANNIYVSSSASSSNQTKLKVSSNSL